MSRIKKSRKPGVGKRETISEADKKKIPVPVKKPRKKVGKQPGNRQKEAFENKTQSQSNNAPKDPRIGSKTPIDLTPKLAVEKVVSQKPEKQKTSPIAAIRRIEPESSITAKTSELEDELYAIEDDQQLQHILALQDEDKALSEAQIDYFNAKMDRHQALRELLGLDDEDEEDNESTPVKNSEEDLWDSLDNTDLPDY